MKRLIMTILFSGLFVYPLSSETVEKTFKGIDRIKLDLVSSDCVIQSGNGPDVRVVVTFTYSGNDYEPEFDQIGSKLQLSEHFSRRSDGSSGKSNWQLTVPADTEIDFNSASGDVEIMGLSGDVTAETASGDVVIQDIKSECEIGTASGDIEASNIEGSLKFGTASGDMNLDSITGDFRLGTASGDIRADNLKGEMKIGTASGDIRLSDVEGSMKVGTASGDLQALAVILTNDSEFGAASGDVEVSLAQATKYDMDLAAASGDVVIDFQGNELTGTLALTARASRNRIKAPFDFDDEKFFTENGYEFVTKTVSKGTGRPVISLKSSSGKVSVKE